MQRERQILAALCGAFNGSVDILSLGASQAHVRKWLASAGLHATVLGNAYARVAKLNARMWYGGGVLFCNKLRWMRHFHFPSCTPLPHAWIRRYDLILCFYAWPHRLLRLERAGARVVVDLNDVMADRHDRIGARRWISLHARDERAVLQSESRCIAISEDDALEFERLYSIRPPVAPFAPAMCSELMALASGNLPPRAGYLGAPNYLNEEVLRLLATPVFLECISRAGIELVVAGGICDTAPPSTLRALKQGGARILGRIESLSGFYSQISAMINPVGPSTGVKIKSVEALMAGRSLITTRWGADANLREAFKDKIACVNWPIAPLSLGELTVRVVRSATRSDGAAAKAYVSCSERALRQVFSSCDVSQSPIS